MSKHTPGPWTAHETIHNLITIESDNPRDDNTHYIAEIDADARTWSTDRANARLIAAAPELLAALDRVSRRWHGNDCDDCDKTIEVVRAAIARATGEE